MKRWLWRSVAVILAVIAAGFVAQKLFGNSAVEPHLRASQPIAVIIRGQPQDLNSRALELRDRYRGGAPTPPAYRN